MTEDSSCLLTPIWICRNFLQCHLTSLTKLSDEVFMTLLALRQQIDESLFEGYPQFFVSHKLYCQFTLDRVRETRGSFFSDIIPLLKSVSLRFVTFSNSGRLTFALFQRFRLLVIELYGICRSITEGYLKLSDLFPLIYCLERKWGDVVEPPLTFVLNFDAYKNTFCQLAIDQSRKLTDVITSLWISFIDSDSRILEKLAPSPSFILFTDNIIEIIIDTGHYFYTGS